MIGLGYFLPDRSHMSPGLIVNILQNILEEIQKTSGGDTADAAAKVSLKSAVSQTALMHLTKSLNLSMAVPLPLCFLPPPLLRPLPSAQITSRPN